MHVDVYKNGQLQEQVYCPFSLGIIISKIYSNDITCLFIGITPIYNCYVLIMRKRVLGETF